MHLLQAQLIFWKPPLLSDSMSWAQTSGLPINWPDSIHLLLIFSFFFFLFFYHRESWVAFIMPLVARNCPLGCVLSERTT